MFSNAALPLLQHTRRKHTTNQAFLYVNFGLRFLIISYFYVYFNHLDETPSLFSERELILLVQKNVHQKTNYYANNIGKDLFPSDIFLSAHSVPYINLLFVVICSPTCHKYSRFSFFCLSNAFSICPNHDAKELLHTYKLEFVIL